MVAILQGISKENSDMYNWKHGNTMVLLVVNDESTHYKSLCLLSLLLLAFM